MMKAKQFVALLLAVLCTLCIPAVTLAENLSTPTDLAPVEPANAVPEDATLAWSATDELDPNRRIEVYISWEGETLQIGDRVTLTAVLYGYDNTEYSLQWQSAANGSNWTDIAGEIGRTLSFVLTEENADFFWRVNVCITGIYVEE